MPETVIKSARSEGRFLDIVPQAELSAASSPCRNVIHKLSEILSQSESDHTLATRVCIPALGSYEWGDLSPQASNMSLNRGETNTEPGYRIYAISYTP